MHNKITLKYSSIDTDYSHPKRESYLRFCTNIKHFLGLNVSKNEFISLKMIGQMNSDYLYYSEGLIPLSVDSKHTPSQPVIYVTIHLGCYHLIPLHLISKGIKICIPVTEAVFNKQQDLYNQKFHSVSKDSTADLKFVNIETAKGLIELISYIKNGYSLVFYIDGNSGIGGMERKDEKLVEVPFFNDNILVRKGIGYISNKLKLDICPIYTIYDDYAHTQIIKYAPSISHTNDELKIINTVWDRFRRVILSSFEQWEPWLYADSYYVQKDDPKISDDRLRFNYQRFHPIIKASDFYFYDNQLNILVKMGVKTYNLLIDIYENRESISMDSLKEKLSTTLLNQILSTKILIY